MLTFDPARLLRAAPSRIHRSPIQLDALDVLCTDLRDCSLSPIGQRVLQGELIQAIKCPIAPDQLQGVKVIVTVGLPRSGTTLFHHLAAATGAVWTLPLWAARSPGADRAAARRDAEEYLRLLDTMSPEVRTLHPMTVDGPEECATARQATFMSERFWYLAPLPRYRRWLEEHPADVWAGAMGMVGALHAGDARPILLKDPSHVGRWGDLDLPGCDVTIVRFLRDPATVAWSFSRLLGALRRLTCSNPPSLATMHEEVAPWLATRLESEFKAVRRGAHKVINVDYRDFTRRPAEATWEVLRACGVEAEDEAVDLDDVLARSAHLRASPRRSMPVLQGNEPAAFDRFRTSLPA